MKLFNYDNNLSIHDSLLKIIKRRDTRIEMRKKL